MKTAAVYDRWLYTLGGGEQVAFLYAEMLRDLGYKTSILTHVHIDPKKAETKLSVNLSNIEIVYLPQLATVEVSPYTENFDVFVNTSYLDYFPSRAKISLLSVFFPGKIFLSPLEYFKRALAVPCLRSFFIYPASFEGFSFSERKKGKLYQWLGEESTIVFNKDVPNLTLSFYLPKVAFSTLDSMQYFVNSKEVIPTLRRLTHQKNLFEVRFDAGFSAGERFSIRVPRSEYSQKIALMSITIKNWRYGLYNWFKKIFPVWEMRLHGGPGVTKISDLESYSSIVTISEFSRKWIQNYWKMDSQILYPTISASKFKIAKQKKNWIIHVGRFFVSGHSKKQLELVRAFTKLVSAYGVRDWELHFVGSVHEGENHRAYFEQVKHEAEGYPVFFHTDVSNVELKELLSKSKIYWHATGLDENEETQPILFEHFGITTVEAMASGCVPVVIKAGGQKEIVTDESGFLWSDRSELIRMTLNLIEDTKLLSQFSLKAIERSKYFDKSIGVKRFEQLLRVAKKKQ